MPTKWLKQAFPILLPKFTIFAQIFVHSSEIACNLRSFHHNTDLFIIIVLDKNNRPVF